MQKYVILVDNNSDLSEKFAKEFDIEVVFGHYTTPDGKEHKALLEWDAETRDQFYRELKKNPNGYTTCPPNVEEFYKAFEKHVSKGVGILALSISTAISGAYSFMTGAKAKILEKYPDAKIELVDTLRFGPSIGLMASYAANLRKEGKSLEEVYKWLEDNKARFHQTGWMDDLSFVAKKGRINHAAAFFGTLIGIKPLGEFDANGLTTVIGKCKGEKEAYEVQLRYIEAHIENPHEQMIFIATTNRHAQAEVYKKMIEERIQPKSVFITDVYTNCGINIGPGLMAAYYYGKPISEGLEEEKKSLASIIEEVRKA